MRIKGRNKKEPRLAICRGFRRRGSAPRSVKRNTAALEDSSGGLPGSVRFRTCRQTARRFFAAACCRPKCRGPSAASKEPSAASKEKAPGAANRPGLPPRIRLSGVHAVLSAKTFHQGLGVIICRGAFLFGSLANMPTACGRLKHPDIEIPPPCVRPLQFVCILGNQWGVRAFVR